MLRKYQYGYQCRLEANEFENSGWIVVGIDKMFITVLDNAATVKSYGSWKGYKFPYPKKIPGSHHIININTDTNCVEFSMIAHFMRINGEHNLTTPFCEKTYRDLRGKYFNMPDNVKTPIAINDFEKIEKSSNTNITIYRLYKREYLKKQNGENDYAVRIIRKGTNMTAPPERHIYLLQLLDYNHVTLIVDIQAFLRIVLRGGCGSYKNSSVCKLCLGVIHNEKLCTHEKICAGFSEHSAVIMPESGAKYKFNKLSATEKTPFVAYVDTESSTNRDADGEESQEIISYAYTILDKDDKICVFKERTIKQGDDYNTFAESFLNQITQDYSSLYRTYKASWNDTPQLTRDDNIKFIAAKKCQICNVEFTNEKNKIRHHSWHRRVEYNDEGEIIKGNYIGALCSPCNLQISCKDRTLPVIAHCGGRYDSKFFIDALNPKKHRVKQIIHKSGENFTSMNVTCLESKVDLRFIDSYNFINTSLQNMINGLRTSNHNFEIFKSGMRYFDYQQELIDKCIQKGVFPYEYIDSIEKLNEKTLPSKDDFYSTLTESSVSDEEYKFALEVYKMAKCESINDYMSLYLRTDVLLLAEAFTHFRSGVSNAYGLDPAFFNTMPAYAMECCLYMSETKLDLLTDLDVHCLIENNIRGGFACANIGKVDFNSRYHPDYDADKPCSSFACLDWNSLYALCLKKKLPVGEFYELKKEEIKAFDILGTNIDEDHAYMLLVDYEIPPNVALATDDFPLSIHKYTPKISELSPLTREIIKSCDGNTNICEKLIASHKDQKEYLISLPRLQILVKLGLNVKCIHRIFRFKQEACFANYIEKNITMRKNAESKHAGSYFKLMSNAIYGKTLFNVRKHSVVKHLAMTKNVYERWVRDPLLKRCDVFSNNKVLMISEAPTIELKYPLYLGFWILESSKKEMTDFFYNKLKATYHENVSLIYTDTDSYFLNFQGIEFFDEVTKSPLKDYIDRSNFDHDSPLYDTSMAGQLGKLKSELGSKSASQIIALQPKCYSILIEDTIKCAAKGVPDRKQATITHDKYLRLHEQVDKFLTIEIKGIYKRKNKLVIRKMKKKALTSIDTKRYWISSTKSLAFNHPDIPRNEENAINENKKTPQRKRKRTTDNLLDRDLDLNHRIVAKLSKVEFDA